MTGMKNAELSMASHRQDEYKAIGAQSGKIDRQLDRSQSVNPQ